jgi:hypothetical protein
VPRENERGLVAARAEEFGAACPRYPLGGALRRQLPPRRPRRPSRPG